MVENNSLIYIHNKAITNETIKKASKFCATYGFMLQNNH